jgi:hypothetical protein
VEVTPVLALDSSAMLASEIGLGALRIARAAGHASQPLAPPARLHLLHQILLI